MNIPITTFKEQQGQDFVAFFLSDLHLSMAHPEKIQRLENWIQSLLKQNVKPKVFFLGDVFDLWVGFSSPVKKQVQGLLSKLKQLQDQGGEVYFFEGNHDIHLKPYFQKKWGFKVVPDDWQAELAGLKFQLEHGDLFDPNDKGYIFLRQFLRNPAIRLLLLYLIPGFVINFVGNYFSKKSSKTTRKYSGSHSKSIQDKLNAYAKHKLDQGHDVFICGHTHIRQAQSYENKTVINLGSWLTSETAKDLILAYDKKQNFTWISL